MTRHGLLPFPILLHWQGKPAQDTLGTKGFRRYQGIVDGIQVSDFRWRFLWWDGGDLEMVRDTMTASMIRIACANRFDTALRCTTRSNVTSSRAAHAGDTVPTPGPCSMAP